MTTWELSVALPPAAGTPELVELAESLGYARAWIYDSAPLWEDTFVHLALAAARTARIGLATAVLIPTQRSPMTMASSIATIARLAPGRFRAGFGTGYTAHLCLGQRPMTLAALRTYLEEVRGLLAGETVEIDGRCTRMLHFGGITASRPIPVPIWLSVFGPKGRALAREIADGVIGPPLDGLPSAALSHGTVLEPGEARGSARSIEATAPYFVYDYHAADEVGPDAVDALPGGEAWRRAVDAEAAARPGERHLIVHEGHVTHVTERDRGLLLPHAGRRAGGRSLTGTPEEVTTRLAAMIERGWTEVIYTPTGPDVERELRAMSTAAAPLTPRGP